MNNIERKKIAQKGFTSLNLLNINSYIEYEQLNNSTVIPKDVIYIEIANGKRTDSGTKYDMQNKFFITFNTFELRALAFACKAIRTAKKSKYIKYADTKLSGSQQVCKKTFNLTYEKKDDTIFYLNASTNYQNTQIQNQSNPSNSQNYSYAFNTYEFPAFISILEDIAQTVDKYFYAEQRRIDQEINNKNE